MTRWSRIQYKQFRERRGLFDDQEPAASIPTVVTSAPKKSPQQRLQALGRLKTGEMNKTESRYDAHLRAQLHAGAILWYKFEGIKLRLADNTFYTPDFAVMQGDGSLECHEVKGFMKDDANVKIKVAAATFPLRFILVKVRSKREGGGWEITEI